MSGKGFNEAKKRFSFKVYEVVQLIMRPSTQTIEISSFWKKVTQQAFYRGLPGFGVADSSRQHPIL